MCTIESNRSGEKPVGSLTSEKEVVGNRGEPARGGRDGFQCSVFGVQIGEGNRQARGVSVWRRFSGHESPELVSGPGVKCSDTRIRESLKPVSDGRCSVGAESRKFWMGKHLSFVRESRNGVFGVDSRTYVQRESRKLFRSCYLGNGAATQLFCANERESVNQRRLSGS